jgi:anti-sigma factor RsiW
VTHFSIGDWTDYVRGLTEGTATSRMRAHLASCKQCGATVHTLEKLVAVIANASPEVPEYAVHNAKSIFASRGTQVPQHGDK